jgi:hypothetical protein
MKEEDIIRLKSFETLEDELTEDTVDMWERLAESEHDRLRVLLWDRKEISKKSLKADQSEVYRGVLYEILNTYSKQTTLLIYRFRNGVQLADQVNREMRQMASAKLRSLARERIASSDASETEEFVDFETEGHDHDHTRFLDKRRAEFTMRTQEFRRNLEKLIDQAIEAESLIIQKLILD